VEILAAPFFARKEITATGIEARMIMIIAFLGMIVLLKGSQTLIFRRRGLCFSEYDINYTSTQSNASERLSDGLKGKSL